jgi:hypothetical protein
VTGRAVRGVAGVALALVVAAGCGRGAPATIERLRAAVAAYAAGQPEPSEAQIDALFAQLDADIAALRAEAAANPAANAGERTQALERERFALWQTYVKARVERLRGATESAIRDVGRQIGQGLEEAGRRIQESMQQ